MKNKISTNYWIFFFLLNISIMALRFSGVSIDYFAGNLFSTAIFLVIFISLFYFFFTNKHDYFLMTWLSFYFASPIIKPYFLNIGALGILNLIFIPLMLLRSFNIKDKYFNVIILFMLVSIFNTADVNLRLIISKIFFFIAPFVFLNYARIKSESPTRVIKIAIAVALINLPLPIYEIIFHPVWGTAIDWRGVRIFGNLFWHNSYALFLMPTILILYFLTRQKFDFKKFFALLILLVMEVLTLSRSSILSLFIGIVIIEWIYQDTKKISMKKILLVATLVFMIVLYFNIQPEIDTHLAPQAIQERTNIWKTILPFIKSSLLMGNGIGSYELYRDQILYSLSTHNYYLAILFEMGLIGLVLTMSYVLFIILDLNRMNNISKYDSNLKLCKVGIAIIMVLLVDALTGNSPFTQVVSLNSWIILGCLLNAGLKSKKENMRNLK